MRQSLVVANWKMNGSKAALDQFLPSLVEGGVCELGTEVVVCPPVVYLQHAAGMTNKTVVSNAVALGAQDISQHSEGAYTGEISGSMLVDMQATWVIVGHSERRAYHSENDQQVALKAVSALKEGLVPIVCVGETLEERESGVTESVIERQVKALVDSLPDVDELAKVVLAYEPIWAIGTGKTASPQQAQAVHQLIRSLLGAAGQHIRILYGGSVKPDNATALFQQPDIDGGLVGGASMVADSFIEICRVAAQKES